MGKLYITIGMLLGIALFLWPVNGKTGQAEVFSSLDAIYASSAVIAVMIVISLLFYGRMGGWPKKAAFIVIAGTVILATGFLIVDTALKILVSESVGVVHWHADFTIDVCGERQTFKGPEGFLENKVGTPLLHHHDEGATLQGQYRIHIEGIVDRLEDVDLGSFFEVIGGSLADNYISFRLADGTVMEVNNGDLCNGTPGEWKVLVNGKGIGDPAHYVIAPYSNVPPGDFIEFKFEPSAIGGAQ